MFEKFVNGFFLKCEEFFFLTIYRGGFFPEEKTLMCRKWPQQVRNNKENQENTYYHVHSRCQNEL